MAQPDNHIDEANLLFIVNQIVDGVGDAYDKAKRIDQHYANFYRNKIPEKKKVKHEHSTICGKYGCKYAMEFDDVDNGSPYNQAVQDVITAQFNNKEGNDV